MKPGQVARNVAAGTISLLSGDLAPALSRVHGAALRPFVLNDARLMLRHMSGLIEAAAAENLAAFRQRAPAVPQKVSDRPVVHSLSSMLLPSVDTGLVRYRVMAHRRLAATALAIRLYSLEHDGRRPGDLAELVPTLLAKVPADPLAADGAGLRYVNDAQRPRIYSVGEDGTDDGGDDTERRLPLAMRGPMDIVFDLILQPRPVEEEQ